MEDKLQWRGIRDKETWQNMPIVKRDSEDTGLWSWKWGLLSAASNKLFYMVTVSILKIEKSKVISVNQAWLVERRMASQKGKKFFSFDQLDI